MRIVPSFLLVLALSTNANAENNPFKLSSENGRRLANQVSNVTVGTQIGLEIFRVSRLDGSKKHNFTCLATRNLVGYGINEVLKRVVKRTRPDGSDRKSFPSMHTMFATVNARGWSYSLSISTAWERGAADKHYITDTAFGFGLGELSKRVCKLDGTE